MSRLTNEDSVDVLVIGAGPAGGAAALALSSYGISTRLITKYGWLSNSPRAHITNQRTGEVLRHFGVEDEIKKYASPWKSMGDTLFTTSLAGPEIARIRTWGTGDDRYGDYLAASPCEMMDVLQPDLEAVLVRNAASRGSQLAFDTLYLGHSQDTEGVTTHVLDRRTNRDYTIRSKYLIGADGAASKVAEDIELPFEGEMARAATIYVRFKCDLSKYAAHRPSILYWIASQTAGYGDIGLGLLRAVHQWDEWIAGWGHDLAEGEPVLHEAELTDRIRSLIGDPQAKVRVESSSVWYVNEAYATRASDRRVFCAGDAIHRHPPSGGLGSNTCVQDAFNLAWKLAFVLRGYANPKLLETYSAERAPVAQQVVRRANQSRREYSAFREVIQKASAGGDIELALKELHSSTADGAILRAALVEAMQLKNFEFNAHGIEMNQRYDSAAVVPPDNLPDETFVRDSEIYAQPSTRPGCKTPHVWLVNEDGLRTSILDLLPMGKLTLVTGLSGGVWVEALQGMRVTAYTTHIVVGTPGAEDRYGDWSRLREIREDGMLLIRPDGYVAARIDSAPATAEEAKSALDTIFSRLLLVGDRRRLV
ncbi:FAD-dependent monooxygenase [Arthrobacter sulfonylureivorans]|uniref:FAD-dependent monooxygenase n=1 Tax=Arthrobacter sulfonylureivorans TaxID=2486855 RepID=A0ABY3WEW6_9MICC|nr:FAD-dependent monooxygenase [Arthrobacter sulfonylureivorans]UNK47108.1 FAD-dependent monooxygenase [Arthrobacter sulfonylureivorans]